MITARQPWGLIPLPRRGAIGSAPNYFIELLAFDHERIS